jgi:ammonium transporter, Amt family
VKHYALGIAVGLILVLLMGPLSLWGADAPTAAEPKAADTKPPVETKPPPIDGGDTAWVLISTGLVLFMVPGLALFYGGMVRRKNVLGTIMHSMVALGIVGVQWVLIGYCLAFGKTQGGWIGWDPNLIGLWNVDPSMRFAGGTKIPIFVHCMYQGMFAIITPALISGALAERVKFGAYCLFLLLWSTLVYDPLAHWVWAVEDAHIREGVDAQWYGNAVGWLGSMGALDFAGGTVVHISAGFSALAAILLLPRRRGYPEHTIHPNSMVLTLLGAGILWFGWFGFNGGSALSSGSLAGLALTNSQVAAAAAAMSWMFVEWFHRGKPTGLGFASGLVAGLVAITPASGFVHPFGALLIGLIAGVVCYGSVLLKPILKYDDSLDAFGVHGVGGFLGAVLTGVFASAAMWSLGTFTGVKPDEWPDFAKLFINHEYVASGRAAQIWVQFVAAIVAAGYGFVATLILVKAIDLVVGFNVDAKAENDGLDVSQHGELGFDFSPALDLQAEIGGPEPRAADVPPNGKGRFSVIIEGPTVESLRSVWSALCQSSNGSPPSAEFLSIYPYVNTLQGNRFRFRGGDRSAIRASLQRLFQDKLGDAVQAHIES